MGKQFGVPRFLPSLEGPGLLAECFDRCRDTIFQSLLPCYDIVLELLDVPLVFSRVRAVEFEVRF